MKAHGNILWTEGKKIFNDDRWCQSLFVLLYLKNQNKTFEQKSFEDFTVTWASCQHELLIGNSAYLSTSRDDLDQSHAGILRWGITIILHYTVTYCRSWYAVVSWLQRQDFFSQYFLVIQDGFSWTDPAYLESKDDRIPSDLLQSQDAETVFRSYVQILRLEHRKMEYDVFPGLFRLSVYVVMGGLMFLLCFFCFLYFSYLLFTTSFPKLDCRPWPKLEKRPSHTRKELQPYFSDIHWAVLEGEVIHRVWKKNIPNIIDCHLKKRYPITIIFGTNISGTAGHQMTIQHSTSLSVCFCTTRGKQNQQNMSWHEQKYVNKHLQHYHCDLRKNWQILIIFDANIFDPTFHQITILVPTPPNVDSALPGKTRTSGIE